MANETNEIFTKQVKPIHPVKFFFMSLGESLLKLVLWVGGFILSLFTSIWSFLVFVGRGAVNLVFGIYKFFKRKCHQFKYNDVSGRLSFAFFGSSSLAHKQIVNGVMYLIFEIGYITLFVIFGIPALGKLGTLGSNLPHFIPDPDDPMFEIFVPGDNSIMILIYGLLWALSLILFLYIWNRSINSGYTNYRIVNFKKFEKYAVETFELSEKMDLEAREAYKNKVQKSEFEKKCQPEIDAFVGSLQDKEQIEYSIYLLREVVNHSYDFCRKLEKAESKIAKEEAKLQKYIVDSEAGLHELEEAEKAALTEMNNGSFSDDEIRAREEKSEAKVEIRKNKIMLKTNALRARIAKEENKRDEIVKCYSHYSLMQHTLNNNKYGKYNSFFKNIADWRNDLVFYEHYFELKDVYEKAVPNAAAQNEKNAAEIVRLEQEYRDKCVAINKQYDEISANKAALKVQIDDVKKSYNEKVKEIKAQHPENEEELLNQAKLDLVEKSTRLINKYNDLPSDKNIKAMKKEELSEVRHSFIRDKKYLKTNLTGEKYGREEAINKMLLDYKLDYSDANKYADILLDKNGFKSEAEVQASIDEINQKIQSYEQEHEDRYVGKPRSFGEQVKGLLNEHFHITILTLPILGILLVSIVPLLFSILIAFTNYSKGHEPPTQLFTWIGFENFTYLFNPPADSIYKDLPESLGATLSWTIIWAIAATFSNYILGIIVALLINKESIKLKKLWRTIFVMTIAVPQFVSLLSIRALLQSGGALDQLWVDSFGHTLGFATSANVGMTKLIIILVNIWVGIPYTILSTTGILLNIPKDLYESAKVDGAGVVKQFTKITMPYILFVTGPYLITQFVGNINNFNVIYFLTQGRPTLIGNALGVGQTDLLITFLYSLITSNSNPQYGIASTVGIVIFILCSFFSIVMYNRSGAIKEEDQFQ